MNKIVKNRTCVVSWLTVLLLSGILALGGCPSEPDRPEVREPRCLLRSASEPGRLTLDTAAENHGAIPPCNATVNMAIARNTALRGINTRIEVVDSEQRVLHDETARVVLQGPEFGMYRSDVHIDGIEGHSCRRLTLNLELLECNDGDGNRIDCPDVEVKESLVLQEFNADGPGLSVCFDD